MVEGIHTAHSGVSLTKVNPVLIEAWKRLQAYYDGKLMVTSGYRSPAHNKNVGGAKRSQHMKGSAFDFITKGMSEEARMDLARQWRRILKDMGYEGRGGVGIYRNNLHFDIGPARAWGSNYRSNSIPKAWSWIKGAGGPVTPLAGLGDGHEHGDGHDHGDGGDGGDESWFFADEDKNKDGTDKDDEKSAMMAQIAALRSLVGKGQEREREPLSLMPVPQQPRMQPQPAPVSLAQYYAPQAQQPQMPQMPQQAAGLPQQVAAGLSTPRVRFG